MVAAAAMSNLLGSVVSIPFAHGIASVTGTDLFILAMFGFFQVALGLTLFVLGSRLLPSGQAIPDRHAGNAADAVLGVAGVPGDSRLSRALVGGALVMGAVDRRHRRRYRARGEQIAGGPDHPST